MPQEHAPRLKPDQKPNKNAETSRPFAESDEAAENKVESESVGRMMQEVAVRLGPTLQAIQEADRMVSKRTAAMVDVSAVEGGVYRRTVLRPTADERATAAEAELARELTANHALLEKNAVLKEAHDKMQEARSELIKKRLATSWKTQLLGLAMIFQAEIAVLAHMKPKEGSTFDSNATTLAQNIIRGELELVDNAREFLTGTRSMPVVPDKTKMTRETTDSERIIGILANEKINEEERSRDLIHTIDGDYHSIPDAVSRGEFDSLSDEQRERFCSILEDERAWRHQDTFNESEDGSAQSKDALQELDDLQDAILSLRPA